MHSKFSSLNLEAKKLIYKDELIEASIVNRPNRYVALVRLQDGSVVRAHTPVGGRIGGLTIDGLPCLLSGPYPDRSTEYTVEALGLGEHSAAEFQWLGINQTASNAYVKEFLLAGLLPQLAPGLTALNANEFVKPERKLGSSRIDFLIESPAPTLKELWIEVKTPLIKLHAKLPESISIKTDYSSNSIGARMPKQMNDLLSQLSLGKRVVMLASFIYKNTLLSSDDLKLRDNLDLDGVITKGKKLGLETWQINFTIDSEGVTLAGYQQLS